MQSDKKVNNGEEIDMVDSSTGADYLRHRPEEETVMLLKNDERRLPNSNKCNNKQANDDNGGHDGSRATFDKRNHCDKLREKNATNSNETIGVNNNGNIQSVAQTVTTAGDDLFVDDLDEDPYAELQSYLEKVKVSTFFPVSFYVLWFEIIVNTWMWDGKTNMNAAQHFSQSRICASHGKASFLWNAMKNVSNLFKISENMSFDVKMMHQHFFLYSACINVPS